MTRYRPYSRREYKSRLAHWTRRHLKVVVLLTSGMIGLLALVTYIILAAFPHTALSWWVVGAFQVALVATYLHFLNSAFLAHDPKAIGHLRGAWGEENTRSELHRARRKGLIWGWVDSITIKAGDLDHLVVTSNGGLVAVDSKWRNEISDTTEMARSARKAKLRAESSGEEPPPGGATSASPRQDRPGAGNTRRRAVGRGPA
jgi:hypothetical protein